jgi:reductive dehalogenase
VKSAAEIYKLNKDIYRNFPEENNCFFRALYDEDFPGYLQFLKSNMTHWVDSGEPGFSRVDLALYAAAWTIDAHMPFTRRWDPKPSEKDYIPKEIINRPPDPIPPEKLTQYVKRAAQYFGASQVGITKLDSHWLYEGHVKIKGTSPHKKEDIEKKPYDIPSDVTNAIIIAIEMEPKGIRNAPNFLEVASVGWGYSQMAIIATSVAQFIRNLGYFAIPASNDTAASIPLAIDAGLGAQGRNGLLLTKKWGPRVRLCKILTNMPLVHDSPDIAYINKINNFCKTCLRCAEACEAEAISQAESPDTVPRCSSNNPGVEKWYVDTNACYSVWVKYSTDCGRCIQVCPFSKTPSTMTPEEFWKLEEF